MTELLTGQPVAAALWAETGRAAAAIARQRGRPPSLAIVQVGADPASGAYARQIVRAFERHGLAADLHRLPADAPPAALHQLLAALGDDPDVDGVLLQQPLPAGLRADEAAEWLPSAKDVEGLHPLNLGRLVAGQPGFVPSTPLAGLELLRHYGIPIAGRRAVVVGRSRVVGLPLALLLLREHATVSVAHSRTADLAALTREADLLLCAVGRPGLVRGGMIKPGAVVVDFGTTPQNSSLVGDVDFAAAQGVAGAITPVPGGVGPVTVAVLARSVVRAAEGRASAASG